MKPKQENWTLVIIGFWNRMIFMPDWVNEKLFRTNELEKLVPLVPLAPLIYRDEDVSLMVEAQRLVVNARKPTVECIGKVEQMACDVLLALPDTPVSAVGLNFGFIEDTPDEHLLSLFDFADNANIGALNWSVEARTITRELHNGPRVLNLTLGFRQGLVHLDANFHHSVKKAVEARDAIHGKSRELYEELQHILTDVYRLHLEEGE